MPYILTCMLFRALTMSGSILPVLRWPPRFWIWEGRELPFCCGNPGNWLPAWLGTCPDICPDICAWIFIFPLYASEHQVPHNSDFHMFTIQTRIPYLSHLPRHASLTTHVWLIKKLPCIIKPKNDQSNFKLLCENFKSAIIKNKESSIPKVIDLYGGNQFIGLHGGNWQNRTEKHQNWIGKILYY